MLHGPGFLGTGASKEAAVSLLMPVPTPVPFNRYSPGSALPGLPAPISGSTVMRPALRAAPRGVFLLQNQCLLAPTGASGGQARPRLSVLEPAGLQVPEAHHQYDPA